jgi:5-methyltetrahydropteroyltriglutamate--homocysteine methyltransferase
VTAAASGSRRSTTPCATSPRIASATTCAGAAGTAPNAHDIELAQLVDILLEVKAHAYLIEGANARHEHEWAVWREVSLPPGRILIPGVVTHSTNVVEHPELVAQRIVRYAEAVGAENVVAGTDCGFGGRSHPQIAWAKLDSLVQGARLASRALGMTPVARD